MIAAVVLAAGGSSRLGRPKQLVDARPGRTLLRNAVEAARDAGCAPIVVVLGAHIELLRPEVADLPVRVVRNRRWEEGLASSIRCGVQAVEGLPERPRGVVLLACDQPALATQVVRALIEARVAAANDGKTIVACEYAGSPGTPALFDARHFAELRRLRGARGAKCLMLERPERVYTVSWPEGERDVDLPGDLPDAECRSRSDEL